LNLQK